MENDFVLWLLKRRAENTFFSLGFLFAFIGYSFWKPIEDLFLVNPENEGTAFYVCISISFFFYTMAYFLSKYDKWRWFPMFVTSICFGRIIQELFYPLLSQSYDWLEYFYFVLTAFIVFFYWVKHQHQKYKTK